MHEGVQLYPYHEDRQAATSSGFARYQNSLPFQKEKLASKAQESSYITDK